MKIAFTSCFDVLDDKVQTVWAEVAKQDPDVLLLLGDSVYMDYGFSFFSDHPLGKPQKWSSPKFADEMYRRYREQSRVETFRSLVESVSHVGAIWDDHDFAWNDSSGKGLGSSVVPREKKLIARALHMQFRQWLRTRPLPNYPEKPSLDDLLSGQDTGIEECFDIGKVRFIMLDGRYYREERLADDSPYTGIPSVPELTSLLGEQQRSWLAEKVRQWPGVNIVCSGSPLKGRGDAWEQYMDFSWLGEQAFERTIMLTGDIHDIRSKKHRSLGGLWEFSASGAARPKIGGDSGNFGIAEVTGSKVAVELFEEDGLDKEKIVDL